MAQTCCRCARTKLLAYFSPKTFITDIDHGFWPFSSLLSLFMFVIVHTILSSFISVGFLFYIPSC